MRLIFFGFIFKFFQNKLWGKERNERVVVSLSIQGFSCWVCFFSWVFALQIVVWGLFCLFWVFFGLVVVFRFVFLFLIEMFLLFIYLRVIVFWGLFGWFLMVMLICGLCFLFLLWFYSFFFSVGLLCLGIVVMVLDFSISFRINCVVRVLWSLIG